MKYLLLSINLVIPIYFFSQIDTTNQTVSQRKKLSSEELYDLGFARSFFDFSIYGLGRTSFVKLNGVVGKNKYERDYLSKKGFGIQAKFGNTWLLNSDKNRFFFRMTWLRMSIVYFDGLLLACGPLHPSFGYNFRVSKRATIETNFGGGLLLWSGGDLVDFSGVCMIESKLNLNHFVLGIEYSRKVYRKYKLTDGYSAYNYLNFSFGFRF